MNPAEVVSQTDTQWALPQASQAGGISVTTVQSIATLHNQIKPPKTARQPTICQAPSYNFPIRSLVARHFTTCPRTSRMPTLLQPGRTANVLPIVDQITAAGMTTLRQIADALNARGVRTARGGTWHATTVRNLIGRRAAPPA